MFSVAVYLVFLKWYVFVREGWWYVCLKNAGIIYTKDCFNEAVFCIGYSFALFADT